QLSPQRPAGTPVAKSPPITRRAVRGRAPAQGQEGVRMSVFDDPFDSDRPLERGCACGRHANEAEHAAAERRLGLQTVAESEEARATRVVDAAVMRAIFPNDVTRRRFLHSVGAATALAAIGQFFPLGAAREAFAEGTGADRQSVV